MLYAINRHEHDESAPMICVVSILYIDFMKYDVGIGFVCAYLCICGSGRCSMSEHDISQGRDNQSGFYGVTICIQDRRSVLSKVIDCQVHLSEAGLIIQQTWKALPQHFAQIALHEFVVMPNHMHGIIEIMEAPQQFSPQSTNLWAIIRRFKASACYQIRRLPGHPWFCWQNRYYWSLLSSERRLATMRDYIRNNPSRWTRDSLYRRY